MTKKKRNYTIQHNRRIVTCPTCKKGMIEGMECYNCKRDVDRLLRYPQDVSNKKVKAGWWKR